MPTRAPSYRPRNAAASVRAAIRDSDRRRGSSTDRGYGTAWRNYAHAFLMEHPVCACGCNRPATHVDHIVPVDGADDSLFWNSENHQGLTHACHNRKTKRADALLRALRRGESTAQWSTEEVGTWRIVLKQRGLLK